MSRFSKYDALGAYHWRAFPSTVTHWVRDLPQNGLYMAALSCLADLPEGGLVVEVGCGDGVLQAFLFRRGQTSVGLDFELAGLQLASAELQRRQVPDLLGASDATALALRSGVADAIVAVEVIEHIDDDASFLSECARVLKPTGLLVLTTPLRRADGILQDRFHVREYTRDELEARVGRCFTAVSTWLAVDDRRYARYREAGPSGRFRRFLARCRAVAFGNPFRVPLDRSQGARHIILRALRGPSC